MGIYTEYINRGGHFAPAKVVTLNRHGVVSRSGVSSLQNLTRSEGVYIIL